MQPTEKACPYCGETILLKASRCRFCEADVGPGMDARRAARATQPSQKRGGVPLWVGIIGVVAAIIFGPRLCSTIPTATAPVEEAQQLPIEQLMANAIPTSVTELFDAYQANEMAAQQRFGSQPLAVEGKVDSIQLDLGDEPVVRLVGRGISDARAYFPEQHQAATASLARGDDVTLLCADVSEVLGTPVLRGCMIAAQTTP